MMLDAKKISEAIRMKKKKMMAAEPELVDTDAVLDVDPNAAMLMEKDAQIENALGSPRKMSADDAMMNESEHDAMTMGETSAEMGRMSRLKRLLDAMDL